jgi:DNA-binding winged helix-turn-helix (wHTH) protein
VFRCTQNIVLNIVDVYINDLRVKIDQGSSKPLIHTVRGVGYSITATESGELEQAGLAIRSFQQTNGGAEGQPTP